MTRLDEIMKRKNAIFPEDGERMARVIRSLVSYAEWLEFMLETDEKPRSRMRATWEDLSDDAKELLG